MTRRWVGLGVWVAASLAAVDAIGGEIRATGDITYIQRGDRDLKLDLIGPSEGDGPFPAVFVIHGGAWRTGNKADCRPVMEALAKSGYVAISPQYRFCPKERSPAQVEDVKAAFRWVVEHSREFKVDPDRIGAMGFSAGGHLALMLGLTGPEDGFDAGAPAGSPVSRVKAVVNYYGPSNFLSEDVPVASRGLVRDFLGGSPKEKPEAARLASPVTYLTRDDPPILTFQGTKDPLVPATQAVGLAEAMTRVGVPGRVDLIVGGGHGGWGTSEDRRAMAETLAFLDRHLKRAP